MYRALYDHASQEKKLLSFKAGDMFTLISITDKNWCYVHDSKGHMGYVPITYITEDIGCAPLDVVQSIDGAIQSIHTEATKQGHYSQQQTQRLKKLQKHRRVTIEEYSKLGLYVDVPRRPAPQPPPQSRDTPPHVKSPPTSTKTHHAPPPPPPHGHRHFTSTTLDNTLDSTEHHQPRPRDTPRDTPRHPDGRQAELDAEPTHVDVVPVESDSMAQKSTSPPTATTSATPQICPQCRLPTDRQTDKQTASRSYLERKLAEEGRRDSFNWSLTANQCVDLVRQHSRASYEDSRLTVVHLVSHLAEHLPTCRHEMRELLDALHNVSDVDVETCRDMHQLKVVLHDLKSCHDDSQQRSWPVHQDEVRIRQLVVDLSTILTDANPKLSKKLLVQENYEPVYWLTTFYQMELRGSIRVELLKVFAVLCELDWHCATLLVSSVLPIELVRDMVAHTDDNHRLMYSALVLTMIFSTGEAPPVKHYDHLNKKFVHFLLTNIESPPVTDDDSDGEQVADLFMKVVLAFNLHFQIPSESLVLKALLEKDQAKVFTEKVVMLFNREEDPVFMVEHFPRPSHSVIKLLEDMFSNEVTAGLFYHNDVLVMVDITVREITNLSPGDKLRTEYLSFAYQLIKHCGYEKHKHRRAELQKCFSRIEKEEEKEAEADRYIVQQILQEFPQFFTDELTVHVL